MSRSSFFFSRILAVKASWNFGLLSWNFKIVRYCIKKSWLQYWLLESTSYR